MAYIFKQKLNMSELSGIIENPKKVLIHEPEEYLAALYSHYLQAHNFDIKHCPNLEQIRESINSFRPDVLVFSVDASSQPAAPARIWKLLPYLRSSFPDLRLISTGLGGGNYMPELMAAGVLGHINRSLHRPQDLGIIIKSILQV